MPEPSERLCIKKVARFAIVQRPGVVLLTSLPRPKGKFWCSDNLPSGTVSLLLFLIATLQCIMESLMLVLPQRELKVQSGNLHKLTTGMSIFTGKTPTYFQKKVQSQARREKERMQICLIPPSPSLPLMTSSDRKHIKSHTVGSWKWAVISVWVLGTQEMQKPLQNHFFVNEDYIKVKINI